jgi:hypothetical protein
MFKLVEKYLQGLFRGWSSLNKRASLRVRDQVFLLLTFVMLQQLSFIVWFIALYTILVLK